MRGRWSVRARPFPLLFLLATMLLGTGGLYIGAAPASHDPAPSTCEVMVRWGTYWGELVENEAEFRVKGGLQWRYLKERSRLFNWLKIPGGYVATNGRLWNWLVMVDQNRCERERRFRFRIEAPPVTTSEPKRNNPHAGNVRILYYPSKDGWTRSSNIDLGWLDLCVADETKCEGGYYPSGPTPLLPKPEGSL